MSRHYCKMITFFITVFESAVHKPLSRSTLPLKRSRCRKLNAPAEDDHRPAHAAEGTITFGK
jgi:hypothetical protein